MKQVSLIIKVLPVLIAILFCTEMRAQVNNNLVGLWTCEEKGRSNDCQDNWYLYKLNLGKDGKFSYAEGYKRIFLCEQRVGAYIYAQKEGTYSIKDSTLVLTFNNSPVKYDSGPIFTSEHGNTVRTFTLERNINPLIEKYREITKQWVDDQSKQPFKSTIVKNNAQELKIEWDSVSDEGETVHNFISFTKENNN